MHLADSHSTKATGNITTKKWQHHGKLTQERATLSTCQSWSPNPHVHTCTGVFREVDWELCFHASVSNVVLMILFTEIIYSHLIWDFALVPSQLHGYVAANRRNALVCIYAMAPCRASAFKAIRTSQASQLLVPTHSSPLKCRTIFRIPHTPTRPLAHSPIYWVILFGGFNVNLNGFYMRDN